MSEARRNYWLAGTYMGVRMREPQRRSPGVLQIHRPGKMPTHTAKHSLSSPSCDVRQGSSPSHTQALELAELNAGAPQP